MFVHGLKGSFFKTWRQQCPSSEIDHVGILDGSDGVVCVLAGGVPAHLLEERATGTPSLPAHSLRGLPGDDPGVCHAAAPALSAAVRPLHSR